MNNIEVTTDFINYIKDFIPKEDCPNDCEIMNIMFGYKSCYFKYKSPVRDIIQDCELILDAF